MTHSQSWDIEKYRSEHEPKHHWQLKKKFMEHHKDRFPETELVSCCNFHFSFFEYNFKFKVLLVKIVFYCSIPGWLSSDFWQYRVSWMSVSKRDHGADPGAQFWNSWRISRETEGEVTENICQWIFRC